MKNLRFTGLKYSYEMFKIVNNYKGEPFSKYQWMVRLDGSPVFGYRNNLIMFDNTGTLYYCTYSYCKPMSELKTTYALLQNKSVKVKITKRRKYAIIGEYQYDIT